MSQLNVNDRISIPLREFDFSYSRSSGAGGQHVNKVNTKVTLRWRPDRSSLPSSVIRRLTSIAGRRINKEGVLQVSSQRYRDQGRNVADCLEKVRALVARAAVKPRRRRKTKPTRASKEARLADKKKRSERKELRRRPEVE